MWRVAYAIYGVWQWCETLYVEWVGHIHVCEYVSIWMYSVVSILCGTRYGGDMVYVGEHKAKIYYILCVYV